MADRRISITDEQIAAAHRKVARLYQRTCKARDEEDRAAADALLLELKRLALEEPHLTGVTLTVEWDSDHGTFFETTSLQGLFDVEVESVEAYDAVMDLTVWSATAGRLAFEMPEEQTEATLSRAQLLAERGEQ